MLGLTTQEGDVVIRTDESKTYIKNSGTAGSMADFTHLVSPTGTVTTVDGHSGTVTANDIRDAVESATDSNTFTDADHTRLGTTLTTSDRIDEDNMSSNSNTKVPTQQSVKAYVDAIPDVIDEDNFATDSASRPPSQQSVKAYITANAASTGSSGATFTGHVSVSAQKELRLLDADSSNYVGLKAPATVGANIIWIMPATDGNANQSLTTDGSGNLQWASSAAGASITDILKYTNL